MAFVKLSDEDSEIDAVIFPDLYRDVSRKISNEMIVFVKGKVDQRNGRTQLILADISPFSKEALNTVSSKRLFVKVTDDNQQQVLNQIKEIADRNPGNTAVLIYQPYTKRTYKLASDYYVQLNQTCLKQFYQAFGKEKVAIK